VARPQLTRTLSKYICAPTAIPQSLPLRNDFEARVDLKVTTSRGKAPKSATPPVTPRILARTVGKEYLSLVDWECAEAGGKMMTCWTLILSWVNYELTVLMLELLRLSWAQVVVTYHYTRNLPDTSESRRTTRKKESITICSSLKN
jgi:hypothetical protein